MPKVLLKGLNTRKNSTGKWYVSIRSNGKALLTAFEGSRDDLRRHMASPDFLALYAAEMERAKRGGPKVYPDGTLGAEVAWFETRDAWKRLAERTKKDYRKARDFLEPSFVINYQDLTGEDVIEARDRAAEQRYAKFSNDVVAYLSALFRESKDARRRPDNPATGIKRLYKADPDANRRWTAQEWETAYGIAPAHLRPVLAIAKHCGLRGQDIAALTWDNYRDDPDLGKALAFVPEKNGEKVGEITIGVTAELRSLLDAMKAGDGVVQPASNAPICRNSLGKAYPSENAMRKAWQDFKQSKVYGAAFGEVALPQALKLTLHGLRVTFASELRESGFSDREVADMLGDLSEAMGKRYSRGAEMRKTSIRVHKKRVQNAS